MSKVKTGCLYCGDKVEGQRAICVGLSCSDRLSREVHGLVYKHKVPVVLKKILQVVYLPPQERGT